MGKYFVKYTVAHHYESIPPIIREHVDILDIEYDAVSMDFFKKSLGNDRWPDTDRQQFSSLREIILINKL